MKHPKFNLEGVSCAEITPILIAATQRQTFGCSLWSQTFGCSLRSQTFGPNPLPANATNPTESWQAGSPVTGDGENGEDMPNIKFGVCYVRN